MIKRWLIILSNSVDPDEMSHFAAFHLGLHCLPEYQVNKERNKPIIVNTEFLLLNF